MRILGARKTLSLPPVRAEAAPLPQKRSDGALTEILPPFGTNPPTGPATASGSASLASRLITNDPRELWYLALPSKLLPKQVVQILRSALGGDLWQQWQLLCLMLDSWPMFAKCSRELRDAVCLVKFVVRPHAEPGEEPTPSATEKANLVQRAMHSFRPNAFNDEKDFVGLIHSITDGILNGLSMTELMWMDKVSKQHGKEVLPRACAWLHPRHFTFTNSGFIAVFDDMYRRLTFNTAAGQAPDPNKFVCGQFANRSGSSLGQGLMRPLALQWSARTFNQEWMLEFAQKYGNPFLEGTYKPGTPDAEVQAMNAFLQEAGSQGTIMHPEGSTITVHPAQPMGQDSPQVHIDKRADDACQLLLLGQTATTHATPGKLGGSDTHDKVKREVIEGVAAWVARVLTNQFATAVLRLNYGNDDECPTIVSDFTESPDPVAQAQRDQVFLAAGVPMLAEEFYERHNMRQPMKGDQVMVGGKLGVIGDTRQEINPIPAPPVINVPGNPGDEPPFGKGKKDDAEPDDLNEKLAEASDEEIKELLKLTVNAVEAPHVNGEWQRVLVKVKDLKGRRS